jgi:hypothetical protein
VNDPTTSAIGIPRRAGAWLTIVAVVVLGVVAVLLLRDTTANADYASDCAGAVPYDPSMGTNLTLGPTDVIVFQSGTTFTGSVNSSLGTICVAAGATYNPSNVNGASRVFVRGTVIYPPLAAGNGAQLDNEGSVTFQGAPNTNGVVTVVNRPTGTMVVEAANISLGAGASITNDGTLEVQGGVNLNGSTVVNNGALTIDGEFNIVGSFTNTATATVGGTVTVNGGGELVNECSLLADALINDALVQNDGVIDVDGEVRNNAGRTYVQGASGVTLGTDFDNSGSVTGGGQYRFTGTTLTEGSFVGGDPPTVFEDTSPTGGQIFDVQLGTITNVVRATVTPPPPGACSSTPPPPTTSEAPPTTDTPDTSTPDTSTPDSSTPDTSTPDSSTPDTSTPDTSTPDTTPDTSSPDSSTPDTDPDDTTTTPTTSSPVTTTTSAGVGGGSGGALPSTGGGTSALVLVAACVVLSGVAAGLAARRPR